MISGFGCEVEGLFLMDQGKGAIPKARRAAVGRASSAGWYLGLQDCLLRNGVHTAIEQAGFAELILISNTRFQVAIRIHYFLRVYV